MKKMIPFLLLPLALLALACDDGEPAGAAQASAQQAEDGSAVLPADLVAEAPPEGATGVSRIRSSAADGDQVVVEGVVGGREEPIGENRAIFTLLDPSVQTCDRNEDDACEAPWDACCEPADVVAANSASVQVVDEAGRPLRTGLIGVGGLAPLKRVIVVGTYHTSPDGQAVTVDASQIYVQP